MFSYEYAYVMESLSTGMLSALVSSIPSVLFSIAAYVMTSLALYTIAQRRGLNRPWLAWIPVVNCWIVGSLSDQYRYVVKDEIKSKRKVLLILQLIQAVLSTAVMAVAVAMIFGAVGSLMRGASEEQILESILGPAVSIVGMSLPLAGVAIAYVILRYMAMYDIYRSMDPANCVLYLVLSILFGVTEPFFLLFNRNKDLGMPPRRTEPADIPPEPDWQPQQPAQEPWEQENKDYL